MEMNEEKAREILKGCIECDDSINDFYFRWSPRDEEVSYMPWGHEGERMYFTPEYLFAIGWWACNKGKMEV